MIGMPPSWHRPVGSRQHGRRSGAPHRILLCNAGLLSLSCMFNFRLRSEDCADYARSISNESTWKRVPCETLSSMAAASMYQISAFRSMNIEGTFFSWYAELASAGVRPAPCCSFVYRIRERQASLAPMPRTGVFCACCQIVETPNSSLKQRPLSFAVRVCLQRHVSA